jgi:hypothetical protein
LNHFCTISTKAHLFKTKALADSLNKFNTHLHVLVVDEDDQLDKTEHITYYNLKFITSVTGLKLIAKYCNQSDKLRWALKSIFMLHLLVQTDKIIYVDNDIYFYNNPKILFELLDTNSILLTPHFYDSNPNINQNWLEANFKVGLYNAGFIGVNTNATKALQWWSECCLYNIKKSYWRGLFDDQKYLDLLPVLFEGVLILKHKGCNLAGWNYLWYKLDRKKNSEVEIDQTYQLLFIHFAETSLIHFSKKTNFFHTEYLTYIENLRRHRKGYTHKRSYFKTYTVSVYINHLKWTISRLLEG